MRTLILALAILASALSGCVAGGPAGDTAKDAVGRLHRAASDWASDAVLLGLVGVEARGLNFTLPPQPLDAEVEAEANGTDGGQRGSDGALDLAAAQRHRSPDEALDLAAMQAFLSRTDDQLGDGIVPAWGGMFLSHEKATVAMFLADEDGTRLLHEANATAWVRHMPKDLDGRALREDAWTVDSDAAIAAARAGNATLDAAFAEPSPMAVVFYGLDLTEDGRWMVGGFVGRLEFHAVVNITAPELLHLRVGVGPAVPPDLFGGRPLAPLPPPIHETGSHTLAVDPMNLAPGTPPCSTPRNECVEIPFSLPREAYIDAKLTWTLEANDYDLYILHAESREPAIEAASEIGTVGPPEVAEGVLEEGDYIAVVVPWSVAADTWTFDAVFSESDA